MIVERSPPDVDAAAIAAMARENHANAVQLAKGELQWALLGFAVVVLAWLLWSSSLLPYASAAVLGWVGRSIRRYRQVVTEDPVVRVTREFRTGVDRDL